MLELNAVTVTQSTLSRDIKLLNLVKVNEDASSYYMVNPIVPICWEKRLRLYMEDALIMLKPVQQQVVLKTLPGLASSSAQLLMPWKFPRLSLRFVARMSVSLFARIISQLKLVMTTSPNLPHHSFHQRNKKKYPRLHDCLGYFVFIEIDCMLLFLNY